MIGNIILIVLVILLVYSSVKIVTNSSDDKESHKGGENSFDKDKEPLEDPK